MTSISHTSRSDGSDQAENTELLNNGSRQAAASHLQYGNKPLLRSGKRYLYGLFPIEQVVVMAIFPLTLFLGQLVSLTNPDKSYFSDKKNLVNLIFVKQGWFWTTVVFVVKQVYETSETAKTCSPQVTSHKLVQAVARYFTATIWWIFFAQWLFGMPLMDRVFLWTGGQCAYDEVVRNSTGFLIPAKMSSSICRKSGGQWTGGYDPSGHVFLLTHGSLFLWFELLPILKKFDLAAKPLPIAIKVVFGFLALWWWMFLMTTVYFHSFAEKITGLIWGYIDVIVVYLLGEHTGLGKLLYGPPL